MKRARRTSQAIISRMAAIAAMAATAGLALPALAGSLSDNAVIGAEFQANWPEPGAFGLGLSDLVASAPLIGRGGPLPRPPGLHYTLSLSALSGTVLLCDAVKARACAAVPFHSDAAARGDGPVFSGFWRPSGALKLSFKVDSTGMVRFTVDYDGPPPAWVATATPPPEPPDESQFPAQLADLPLTRLPVQPTVVPLPAGVWLLGGAIGALGALRRLRKAA